MNEALENVLEKNTAWETMELINTNMECLRRADELWASMRREPSERPTRKQVEELDELRKSLLEQAIKGRLNKSEEYQKALGQFVLEFLEMYDILSKDKLERREDVLSYSEIVVSARHR